MAGQTKPKYDMSIWDESTKGAAALKNYEDAKSALKNHGDFSFSETEWLSDIKDKIKNYGKFSYDVNSDALYQQYADQYARQGKLASADVMGQAAAMTGGYGNSYAATVGNQAYQSYLQQLNDRVPELYQLALEQHNAGKQDLYNKYGLLLSEYEREYGLHSDEYGKLLDELGIARDDYYSGADMFHTEKNTKNGLLTQEYVNDVGTNTPVTPNTSNNTSGVTSDITDKAASFESNDSLADWAFGLADNGVITEEEAVALIDKYKDPNEKYTENDDGTKSLSYGEMVKSTNGWSIVNDGGINWFWGVDNNAILKAPNGEQIRLDNLVDTLVAEGISKSDAKDYVKKLQKNLGV